MFSCIHQISLTRSVCFAKTVRDFLKLCSVVFHTVAEFLSSQVVNCIRLAIPRCKAVPEFEALKPFFSSSVKHLCRIEGFFLSLSLSLKNCSPYWDKNCKNPSSTLCCFNPMNKNAESSTVTFIEQHFKEICPSVLCDQHCIVHIQHVLKMLRALRSDLFSWATSPTSKSSYSSNMLSVACPQK